MATKVLAAGLKPLLPQMPHLKDLHDQLEQVISQAEDLDARSEALKAQSQEVTRTRDDLAKTGDDLRDRLGAALRTVHGFQSEKLLEFGLKPRKPRGRDRKPRAKRNAQGGQTPVQPAPAQPTPSTAPASPAPTTPSPTPTTPPHTTT